MKLVHAYDAKLVVTPDNSTPGSEGRLYLLFPEEMSEHVGKQFRSVGNFSRDDAILLIQSPAGSAITPRRQLWWKNGVRDHFVRENHHVRIWILSEVLWAVEVLRSTGERSPVLPPHQDTLFDDLGVT
jgi:hypothetical protein